MNKTKFSMESKLSFKRVFLGVWIGALFTALAAGAFMFMANTVSAQTGLPPIPPLPPPVVKTCNVTANLYEVPSGADVTISWTTQGFSTVTLNGMNVSANGSYTFTNIQENTTYTLIAGNNECFASITIVCLPVPPLPPPTCTLTPASATVREGESVTLTWSTQNATRVTLSTFGSVPLSGTQATGPLSNSVTYTLTAFGTNGTTVNCVSVITVTQNPVIPPPTCTLTPASATVREGESVTLTWSTTNAASATLTTFGSVPLSGSRSTGALSTSTSYTLTVLGTNGTSVNCHSNITVEKVPVVIPPPTCTLTPASATVREGESVTLTWSTTNAASATLTTFGSVPLSGSRSTGALSTSTSYTLTVLGTNGTSVSCVSAVTVSVPPPPNVPSCDAFSAAPSTIVRGNSSTLSWSTTNAVRVVINNGIGEVAADSSVVVTPLATIEYILTVFGTNNQSVTCKTTIVVNPPPVTPAPICNSFTATPSSLPVGGGTSVLTWTSTNAQSASIAPRVGTVAVQGSTTVSIATTTTYTLTLTGADRQTVSCPVTVTVAPVVPPGPITCENNVNFTASPRSIDRGELSTLTWSTTGVTSVRFNQGISTTALSGSLTISPNDDITYILTATTGSTTIDCPVTIKVSSGGGGGGGGSSTPTCELTISKNRISRGEEVTLRYESSRASDIELKDSFGKVLVTTRGVLSSAKARLLDGSVRVSPTRDTTYTLTVERGSRDRVCTVKVAVNDGVVLSQVREQQPLVSGISLAQVPYTGFEAGPILTISFYALLMAWSLYVAYLIAIRRDIIGGYKLAESHIIAPLPTPEEIRPDVFVASVRAPEVVRAIPHDLPTGNPVIGYANLSSTTTAQPAVEIQTTESLDAAVTAIENHAHAKKSLLSSDAVRYFMGTIKNQAERITALNDIIMLAKEKYPSEDGWVVINEKRMQELCVACQAKPVASSQAPYVPTVIPEGSGSLAEAIVTGNVIAAYEMIGHRPMFALADAAADLDSVYRQRKGAEVIISDLLIAETANFTDEQIMEMIKALTGALDGVYTDEASAVKMAIMKAVKVVA